MMCYQVATLRREPPGGILSIISTPQYTQVLSLARTSSSSHAGMPHLFISISQAEQVISEFLHIPGWKAISGVVCTDLHLVGELGDVL